jgi:hypothetical protein
MAELVTLVSLGLVTVVGVALTYFAYELAQPLFKLAGAVGGLVAGLTVGVVVLPRVTGAESQLAPTIIAALLGAGLGAVFVPALGRLALGIAGFVATGLAGLVLFTRGQAVSAVLGALPEDLANANPVVVLEQLVAAPAFQESEFGQALLVIAVLGFVGGGLALLYYDVVVVVAATAGGAALLSAVVPVMVTVVTEGGGLEAVTPELSPVLTLVAFGTGVGFQAVRHIDDVDFTPGEDERLRQ